MTHTVAVYPGPILCGKCGGSMRADEQRRKQTVIFLRCAHAQCEQYDVPLVYPLQVIELQRAEG